MAYRNVSLLGSLQAEKKYYWLKWYLIQADKERLQIIKDTTSLVH